MGRDESSKEKKEIGALKTKSSKFSTHKTKLAKPKKFTDDPEVLSSEIKAKYRSDEICWASLTNGQPCQAKKKPGKCFYFTGICD